jgi:GTP-dependent phosphoenolpyruvate carboxykinase
MPLEPNRHPLADIDDLMQLSGKRHKIPDKKLSKTLEIRVAELEKKILRFEKIWNMLEDQIPRLRRSDLRTRQSLEALKDNQQNFTQGKS